MDAQCPYCQAALAKAPTRKTKCKSCGQFMYVKRAPGETEKRIVTQDQADEIEQAWSIRAEQQAIERDIVAYKLEAHSYRKLIDEAGGDRVRALRAIHEYRAEHDGQAAAARRAAELHTSADKKLHWTKRAIEMDLDGYAVLEHDGHIGGVELLKPPVWVRAVEMLALAGMDYTPQRIATITGFTEERVAHVLKHQGRGAPCGPQCDKMAGQLLSVQQARESAALPCAPNCRCEWRPVMPHDSRVVQARQAQRPKTTILYQPNWPEDEPIATPTPIPPEPGPVTRFFRWLFGTSRT